MEKRRKNSYRLDCKWFQTKDDINIDKEDSWVGFVSVFDDNSCIGCAIDARRSKPTHLLIGTMVEGKGLTLTKIHANNPDTIPQVIDFYNNVNYDPNLMFGVYYNRPFPRDDIKKGLTVAKTEKLTDKEQINNISELFKILNIKIMRNGGTPAVLLNILKYENQRLYSQNLSQIYESLKDAEIPEILIKTQQSQPGEN